MSYQDSANLKLQTALRKLAISSFIPTPSATASVFDFDNPQDWKITGDPAKTAINGGPIKAGKGALDFNVPYLGENWTQFTVVPVEDGAPCNVLASKILAGQKTPTAVTIGQATLGVTIANGTARLVASTFNGAKINALQMYVDGGNMKAAGNVASANFPIPAGFHRLMFKAWVEGVTLPVELPVNVPAVDLSQPKNIIMQRRYCIPKQPTMPQGIEFDPGIFAGGKVWVQSISTDVTNTPMLWNDPVKLWKQLTGDKWPMVMDKPTDIILHTTTDAAGVHYRSLIVNGDPIFLDEDIFFPAAPASPDRMDEQLMVQNQIDLAKGALSARVLYRGGQLIVW